GEDLVRTAAESGVPVVSIPGPCAAITALAASGMPTGRFTFEGFLSVTKKTRRERLAELKDEPRTMIFYEAPHKLVYTLADMLEAWGDREVCIARELTKLNEEVFRTTLAGALEKYRETPPRGEFVLIISGAEPEAPSATLEDALGRVEQLRAEGMKLKDASRAAAEETGLSRTEIYNAALRSSGDGIE
ncbi:MAG: 16S rRNA (cytidine(1402)-2'-O)-methyltransferase, partial [Oscillospiraceae bacterium]|nr:16S rRNA (cytidine(1402)-2'-O)-methyltransferase [Oscillospiraceae bacterium]